MSWTPEDSAISLNEKQKAHLSTLVNSEELKAYLAEVALSQGLVERDPIFNNGILTATEKADNARQQITKTVVVNGVSHVLSAPDEVGLLRAETDLFKKVFQPTTTQQTEQPRNERGQFTAAEQAAADATRAALAMSGIDVDALPQTSDRQFTQGWQEATEEFLHSEAGRLWPGGDRNRDTLARILQANNLTDSEDKVAALAQAYEFAKANDLLVDEQGIPLGGRAQIDQLYANAAKSGTPPSAADVRYALGDRSSSLFGSR